MKKLIPILLAMVLLTGCAAPTADTPDYRQINMQEAIVMMEKALLHAEGNFYINDKCTGAVVGQQPFGGARQSGTNDKAGTALNMIRWMSPHSVKETFNPSDAIVYPYMSEK